MSAAEGYELLGSYTYKPQDFLGELCERFRWWNGKPRGVWLGERGLSMQVPRSEVSGALHARDTYPFEVVYACGMDFWPGAAA